MRSEKASGKNEESHCMFKLQRLEITGFKSFADYTEIVFTGDGITAVVGPNGCGKSNVADAIAWVLGEQKVKNLRGSEMKDVIFQGSKNRPPSGMAEVVLHLLRDETIEHEPDIEDIDSTLEDIDEHAVGIASLAAEQSETQFTAELDAAPIAADKPSEIEAADAVDVAHENAPAIISKPAKRHWRRRNLALEFAPGEAVSVARRLFRSGESEYLLNDRPCRLRDIQDLFSGTGLSGGHYAIIEQGRIGQILSAKPMDRRSIIEEAAGITKFRVRQRAAEARLESAKSNLSRLSDIISEIDRQVNSLRRQAAKARRYGVLREELRELLRDVYVAEDQKLAALLEQTQSQLAAVSTEERALAEELARREEDARNATREARRLEDELADERAAIAAAALQRDRQVRERAYQQDQIVELEKRRSEVQTEIDTLAARLIGVRMECERLRSQDEASQAESEQSISALRSAEQAYTEKVSMALNAEAQIERARAELLTHTAVAERLREIARQLQNTLDRLAIQAAGLVREAERAVTQHAERNAEAGKLDEEVRVTREKFQRLIAEREQAVGAVVRGHEAVSDSDAELTRIRDEHSRTRHRLESLKELDDRRAYYSSAVQFILTATDTPRDFHTAGTLADLLNVEAKWERAVEGVFGSSLQSIVVPTPEDAVRAARWLRENNAGRASFLVAGLHGASDEATALAFRIEERAPTAISFADENLENLHVGDLLGATPELSTVLNRTLSQKMKARLSADLDDAMIRSLATGEIYVTLNGDWVACGQLVNAGDARALEEGAGLLAFKRELRELEARAETLKAELALAEGSANEARTRLIGLEDAVVTLNEAIGREEREMMARELAATGLAQEIERAERHLRVVTDDGERLATEQRDLEERRLNALSEAATAEAARIAASETVAAASVLLAEARREAEVRNEGLGEQRAAAAAAAERRRAAAAELRRMEAERDDLTARIDRHSRELVEMMARIEDLGQSIAELDRRAAAVGD